MKKISLLLSVFLLLFVTVTVTVAIAKDGDWVKVEPKVVGQSQLSSAVSGGEKITPPDVSFSYWGEQGKYNVRFYGYPVESVSKALVFVDSVNKGNIIPQRTSPLNSDASNQLLDFADMLGYVEIYEPGIHHVEVRTYITNKLYFSYELSLDVPYFDAGIYGISADQNTVYIKYYLQPIFITIASGEFANVIISDFLQSQAAVQTDQWGYYFVEIGIPMSDYQNIMQNRQMPTTIEAQGHIREWQAYYWQY